MVAEGEPDLIEEIVREVIRKKQVQQNRLLKIFE